MKDAAAVAGIALAGLILIIAIVSAVTPVPERTEQYHEPGPYGGAGVWLGEYDDDGRSKQR